MGTKIIVGQAGYQKLNPFAFKSVGKGWYVGMKYSTDSNDVQTLGPALKYKGKIAGMFVILDYVHDFGLKGGKGDRNECWLYLSTTKPTFNVGGEVLFYNYMRGSTFWQVRPIRLNYKKGVNFFLMPNFTYKDGGLASKSIMAGFDVKF